MSDKPAWVEAREREGFVFGPPKIAEPIGGHGPSRKEEIAALEEHISELEQERADYNETATRRIKTVMDLLSALERLSNEASSLITVHRAAIHDDFGFTNISVLECRLAEAKAVMAKAQPKPFGVSR